MEPGRSECGDREAKCRGTVEPGDTLDQKVATALASAAAAHTEGRGWRDPQESRGPQPWSPVVVGCSWGAPSGWAACLHVADCTLPRGSHPEMGELTAPSTLRPPGEAAGTPTPTLPMPDLLTWSTAGPAPLWTWAAWRTRSLGLDLGRSEPAPPPLPICGRRGCPQRPWAAVCATPGHGGTAVSGAEARLSLSCCAARRLWDPGPGPGDCREEGLSWAPH